MDRISGLNANQVAKELQGYKRYKNKTQKEIKDKVGGVSSLRDELKRLETKKISPKVADELKILETKKKSPKVVDEVKRLDNESKAKYIIKNKEYTEDQLYEMIQFYESHHIRLNKDTWSNVLLQADAETLKTSCIINKDTVDICKDLQFWKLKYEQENLPFIITTDNYIDDYDKIKKIKFNLVKLYNNVVNSKKYDIFSITDDVDINEMTWLPEKMIKSIKTHPDDVDEGINIEFDFKKLTLILYYIATDEDEEDLKDKLKVKIKLTKDEFINYLTKLYFYHENAAITDGDDTYIGYDTLMNDKLIKVYFPKW